MINHCHDPTYQSITLENNFPWDVLLIHGHLHKRIIEKPLLNQQLVLQHSRTLTTPLFDCLQELEPKGGVVLATWWVLNMYCTVVIFKHLFHAVSMQPQFKLT